MNEQERTVIPEEARRLLIVDDDADMLKLLAKMLGKHCQCEIMLASSADAALSMLEQSPPAVVLSDIRMPGMDGLSFFEQINRHVPTITTILMSGYGTIEMAVQVLKKGAYDFIEKPFDRERIIQTVSRALERTRLMRENERLQQMLHGREVSVHGFSGTSAALRSTLARLERVAASDVTVLIRGESGTGKELAAHALHAMSARAHKNMITVNCPALPEAILESELFGYHRGAFTGASQDKAGLFQEADGSTILLDEIADIPVSVQTKLLRVLQEKEFRPLGQNKTVRVDVRVLASTNQDLEAKMRTGHFREDLYHRLNVMSITMPTLQHMASDIIPLAQVFLEKFRKENGREQLEFSSVALSYLMRRGWPGNVRELRNAVQRAVLLCDGNEIDAADFNDDAGEIFTDAPPDLAMAWKLDTAYKEAKEQALAQFHQAYLSAMLREHQGNVTHAARASGLDRQALQRLLRRYGLNGQSFRS